MLIFQILIVLLLIVLNGFFAMSELAIVSARKALLKTMAANGRRGAGRALELAENPGRFLSAVQIGITLIGILAGAVGGSALSEPLGDVLAQIAWVEESADEIAFGLVVAAITYISLVIGELLPKRLALSHAESIAAAVALPMSALARAVSPLVWVLDVSTRFGMRLLRISPSQRSPVTDEEIRGIVHEAAEAGVVEPAEKEMIWGVMRLADRPVEAVMTPRPDIDWIDVGADEVIVREQLRSTTHSRVLVCNGKVDEVLGVVQAKDLLERSLEGKELDLRAVVREVPVVPETMSTLSVLDLFRRSPVHLAAVVDEYGSLMGVVTTSDLTGVIFGELAEHDRAPEQHAVRRPDGSWLLDGGMPVDEAGERLELRKLTGGEGYHTLAGWLIKEFGRLPKVGEAVTWSEWRFEIVDLDGYRIDKVLATPSQQAEPPVE
ncbi:HlyC/CorC family transporter [Persicimonas caeni]|uniref:HlyC/CorC family transporter n=1 Tax=Persicimonas caeni TaxID=2292766 RepID=A0A4Y6PM26_PERCE|nr:hemolysin family protein [Persicimonas caeni]QDG49341.1 HlyC/CorC family transporter [Persicimonas caeni]QED30562.1 HlyC/CorC family transporter [Persicimonas caeni]